MFMRRDAWAEVDELLAKYKKEKKVKEAAKGPEGDADKKAAALEEARRLKEEEESAKYPK